ncbi:MAG TPA: amidase [Ktedonobacterales bacterium]
MMSGERISGGASQTLTAAEAAERLRRGDVTSAGLVRECLGRIERLDSTLLACVTVMGEAALEQAAAADARLQRGGREAQSALLGIPLGIKDLIETRGVRTTGGSRVLADWVPDRDAAVVMKMAQAGAIALCKTNTHEFAFGTVTQPTRNPWDIEHIPGGSSGGSAVAVATGECLAALGTDTGGSIRIPAAACGVTGLKPTYGLVSRAGILPLSWSLDHAGPIARTVEDCALLLDALAGYDAADPDSVEVPLLDYQAALSDGRAPEDAVRGTRIGIPDRFFFHHLDGDVETAVRAAIGRFEEMGASVHEVKIPDAIEGLFEVYRAIQKPEAYTFHRDQGWLDARAEQYAPTVLKNILSGADYSASDYIHAQQARRAFREAMREAMARVDVLMTPTLPVPARRIDEVDTPLLWDGKPEPAGEALRYTFPFDVTGQPALTVPCGFSSSGLPIGLQLVAGQFGEPTLLRLGHAYQRVTDWHRRVPPIVAEKLGA